MKKNIDLRPLISKKIKEKKLKQFEISKKLKIDKALLSKYLNGWITLPDEKISCLCEILEIKNLNTV